MKDNMTNPAISIEEKRNSAATLVRHFGPKIRKHDVRMMIELNNKTKDLHFTEQEKLINSLWRQCKKIV
jgi:hypothetical protein